MGQLAVLVALAVIFVVQLVSKRPANWLLGTFIIQELIYRNASLLLGAGAGAPVAFAVSISWYVFLAVVLWKSVVLPAVALAKVAPPSAETTLEEQE